MYKKQFGNELKKRLLKKQTLTQMAPWFYDNFINFAENKDLKFEDLLYKLMMMDAGPEFELPYEKLHQIADALIAGHEVKLPL